MNKQTAQEQLKIQQKNIEQFLQICLSVSGERDREQLLSDILDKAMTLNRCDAGTLYLLEDDGLHFCRMVTSSQHIRQGGHADPIKLPPVPLAPQYVCSVAVMNNETVYVDNVRSDERFDFSGSIRYDEMTGYKTGTMCVIPLENDKGEIIGAVQLLNALKHDLGGRAIEWDDIKQFDKDMVLYTKAMASLAAISLTNLEYSRQIQELLNSLVQALSTAIDERTPYNANHTRNMVKYAKRFLDWLDATGNSFAFDQRKRDEFLMSVWLHDVGKLVVPLEVMDKASRLGPKLDDVLGRLRVIGLLTRIEQLEGRISAEEAEARQAELKDTAEFIKRVNTAGFLPDPDLERVMSLGEKTFTDENGESQKWLTEDEFKDLQVRKGTLTAEERQIMESHVSVTAKILSGVFFPKQYSQTPVWAAMHHELLNGKGYPNHILGRDADGQDLKDADGHKNIPDEVRLLTILDVFDALTARDRPYKPAMPVERALSILHSMVDEGAMDNSILELFEASRAWEEPQ